MNSHEVLKAVQVSLNEKGFIPYGAVKLGKRPNEDGLLFHEAVRTALGMKFDDSVYMYWEWQSLATSLNAMWNALDDSASRIAGRRTTAVASIFEETTNLEEVIALLTDAISSSSSIEFPVISRRPTKSEPAVRFAGKILGALFATLGSLEETRSSGYGDLFSSLTDKPRTNEELLLYLDEMCRAANPTLDLNPPKSIVILRALGKALEDTNKARGVDDMSELSLGEFLIETEMSANWAGLSDQVILKRLLSISPEDAEAPKKAIEKFLAE